MMNTVISITVSFSKTLYISYTRMPSPLYQYVNNLVVSLPIRRGPGVLTHVLVREHRELNIQDVPEGMFQTSGGCSLY